MKTACDLAGCHNEGRCMIEPCAAPKLRGADIVNSPDHYRADGFETIDAIRAWLTPEQYEGYLRGNAVKYLSRCMRKGDMVNDLRKAAWYLDRLITDLEGGDDERER